MTTEFLGIQFDDDLRLSQVAESICDNNSVFVVTPNVDHVVSFNSIRDNRYKEAIACRTLTLCDSKILKILSILRLGKSIDNVVTGSDLTKALIEDYTKALGSVGLVGGELGDREFLINRYNMNLSFQCIPSFGFVNSKVEVQSLIEDIASRQFDTLFLCVGSPQQEIVAGKLFSKLPNRRYICVGASIDFIMGREKRAPALFQFLALEWLYRLLKNPKKMFQRYVIRDSKIFILWLKSFFK